MDSEDQEQRRVLSLDQRARMDLVLQRFVEGMSIPNIVSYLERETGMKIARDVPYQDISRATNQRWLKYEPPREKELSKRIHDRHPKLLDVFVPSVGERMTTMAAGARLGAEAIAKIAEAKALGRVVGDEEKGIKPWQFRIRVPRADTEDESYDEIPLAEFKQKESDGDNKAEPISMGVTVRIGFSGGHTMALTSHELGRTLAERVEGWEKDLKKAVLEKIKETRGEKAVPEKGIIKRRFKVSIRFVFVNLVAGFDPYPSTNPIAFLSALLHDEVLVSRTTVKVFNGMPFVEIGQGRKIIDEISALRDVREDYDKHGLDVIFTSGSSISDPHSTFPRYYQDDRLTKLLIEKGVQGDFLWLPVTTDKPFHLVDLKKEISGDPEVAKSLAFKPMTLLTLQDIAKHIESGRDVFFIVAPCGVCAEEKSQITKAVLGQQKRLVSHVIMDSTTAARYLGELE